MMDSCDMQIYVTQLKCQHEGYAFVLTFQLRTYTGWAKKTGLFLEVCCSRIC